VLAWLLAGGGEKSCVLAGDRDLFACCLLVSCIKEELVLAQLLGPFSAKY